MSDTRNPFWIGALAGLVIAAAAVPAGLAYWSVYSKDRAEQRGQLAALTERLDKNNRAIMEMQKTASLAGVTRQLDELNTRIKRANEALAELQKTSAGIQRASLEKIAERLDDLDAGLKANTDTTTALQSSVPLTKLSKQIGQIQSNLTALDVALSDMKKTSAAADASKRFDALDANVKALDGRVGEIKTALTANQTAPGATSADPATAQIASALDDIKKGMETSNAASGKLLSGIAGLQEKLQQGSAPQASMDLVVIHAEPTGSGPSAQPNSASAAMAPLGFEFRRLGANEDKAQTEAIAAKVKELVQGRNKCAISVAGYADTVGSDEFNLDLSRQRAHNVAARLRQALGDGIQIAETGWGDRRLQVWTPDNTPKPENRRVDIAVRCEG